MFLVMTYPDLVQPGAGVPDDLNFDDGGELIGFGTRKEAEAALLAAYPGMSLREIMPHAQKRVESTTIS